MYSTNYTCSKGDYTNENSHYNEPITTEIWSYSKQKRCCKESMSRWKWIIDRMRNKWCNTMNRFHSTRSPLIHTKINYCIENKYGNNSKKNWKSNFLIFNRLGIYSIEPKSNKKNGTIEYNEFSGYLYPSGIFRSNKSACWLQEREIEIQEKMFSIHSALL